MPRARSIQDIKTNLLRPSLTSHFEVELGLPNVSSLRQILGANQDKLNLMCSEASLPGSQLTTLDLNNDHTGVSEKHAYRRMFDATIDLTFYVDAEDYLPIRFFEAWIRHIVNEDVDDGGDILGVNYNYRVKYPDEYIAEGLTVRKFERDYTGSLEYKFVRSFPLSISSMPVSYDSSSLLKTTVSMSYIRYVTNPGNPSNADPKSLTPQDFAAANSFINTTGGVVQTVANAAGNSIQNLV